jgi:ceramide glucosyltransferase
VIALAVFTLAGIAAAYQLIALAACVRKIYGKSTQDAPAGTQPVSILKPVRGLDPHFYEAIRSHAIQEYPAGFEILFGVKDARDPAVAVIERLASEFPDISIRCLICTQRAENGKVGVLMELERVARHPILLVNDSDIHVPVGYLRRVTSPLENSSTGLVTCLYNATADEWPGRWEALGIVTDFAPSTLVAQLAGVNEFALGSTLAFRASDLRRAGGFESLADYIADDYQLGRKIHSLGLRCVLSDVIVTTHLAGSSWGGVWAHQLRWARTIRVSRGDGYIGLPVTQASLWALVAAVTGHWYFALGLIAIRLVTAIVAGAGVLGNRETIPLFFLIPFRDLWGSALWLAGLFGNTVEWRGMRLRLDREGRIRVL